MLISNYLDDTIQLPESLIESVHNLGRRVDFSENVFLTWWMIDGWNQCVRVNGFRTKWKQINDERYFSLITKGDSRNEARRWLEDAGFIKIRKVTCKDGKLRNRRIRGKASQRYRTLRRTNYVPYRLIKKSLLDCVPCFTGPDQECQHTRANLGLLQRKPGESGKLKEKKGEKLTNRIHQSLIALTYNKGTVKRGRVVDRLFSPWTGARRDLRSLFTLNDDEIVGYDLRAAQPVLMASLAKDESMLMDCQSDQFFKGLADHLGYFDATGKVGPNQRKKAKGDFYPYVYGPIRKVTTRHPKAYEVQKWMRATYEKTAKYVDQSKGRFYKGFSRRMQNFEARVFVDGAFRQMNREGITALSLHDEICVGDSQQDQARAILHSHLTKNIYGGIFHLSGE